MNRMYRIGWVLSFLCLHLSGTLLHAEEPLPSPSPSEEAKPFPTDDPFGLTPVPRPTTSLKRTDGVREQIQAEETALPKEPERPPALGKKIPPTQYPCYRTFLYEGKRIACDSYIAPDAENLRPLFKGLPEAIAELDAYQKTKRDIEWSAYRGSIGLGLFLLSRIIASQFITDPSTSLVIKNIGLYAGLGFAIGNGVHAFFILQTNEQHISRAVDLYNKARPGHPIELQFSTGVRF